MVESRSPRLPTAVLVGAIVLLLALAALLVYAVVRSGQDDRDALPSALIGKPAPEFALPLLHDPAIVVHARELRGAPYIINVGQLVPCLPRRTPGAEPLRTDQARARDRLQLEGRAQRCAALARTTRQPVSAGGRRSRWPHRHRFRHRRRTGNLPGRRAWGGALEVQRHADPIHHRHPVDSGAEPDRTFPTAAPDLHAKQ